MTQRRIGNSPFGYDYKRNLDYNSGQEAADVIMLSP